MKKIIILCASLLICAVHAYAQTEDTKPQKQWSDEAELSFVSTSGNSETSSIAAKNSLKYKFTDKVEGQWDAAALRSEDGNVKTAERYSTDLKMDYLFTEQSYAGLGAGWLKDEFAGFENRYYVGPFAGYKFLTGPKHALKGELGVNYAQEEYIDKTDEDFIEGRLLGLYSYAITKTAKFSQKLEYLHDFADSDNFKAFSLSALAVAVSDIFSVKTSYEVRYVNRPVPSTLDDTDRILTVALVANL